MYDIDVGEVAELWRRGSVVGSWLVDLTADAFARSPDLDDFAGRVSDSGEGRWTVLAAVDEGVPGPGHHGFAIRAFRVAQVSVSSPTKSSLPCAASSAATTKEAVTRQQQSWLPGSVAMPEGLAVPEGVMPVTSGHSERGFSN